MRTIAATLIAFATAMLLGTPAAMALDQTLDLVEKTIDCSDATTAAGCLECGADPGIYCCIKDLHSCTIKNPPPPPPSKWTGFPTIRRGLGSSLYFTR